MDISREGGAEGAPPDKVVQRQARCPHECIASGQPHLHGSRPPDCIWRAPFASAEEAAQREASSVLEGTHTGSQEQRARALGDFMARSARGDYTAFFRQLSTTYHHQTDKVGASVRVVMEAVPDLAASTKRVDTSP